MCLTKRSRMDAANFVSEEKAWECRYHEKVADAEALRTLIGKFADERTAQKIEEHFEVEFLRSKVKIHEHLLAKAEEKSGTKREPEAEVAPPAKRTRNVSNYDRFTAHVCAQLKEERETAAFEARRDGTTYELPEGQMKSRRDEAARRWRELSPEERRAWDPPKEAAAEEVTA